jgi:hypothetical protein
MEIEFTSGTDGAAVNFMDLRESVLASPTLTGARTVGVGSSEPSRLPIPDSRWPTDVVVANRFSWVKVPRGGMAVRSVECEVIVRIRIAGPAEENCPWLRSVGSDCQRTREHASLLEKDRQPLLKLSAMPRDFSNENTAERDRDENHQRPTEPDHDACRLVDRAGGVDLDGDRGDGPAHGGAPWARSAWSPSSAINPRGSLFLR